jgi:uncharacterized membrane protein YedE/YeeE
MNVLILVLGTAFGFVLSRSGAANYDLVQGMFLFTHFQLYGIIGAAIAVTAPGLWLLRRHGRALDGSPLSFRPKVRDRGTILGGILFGVGWSITGMCPGPIFVNLGEGKLYAIAALAGALSGAYILGAAYPSLSRRFGLDPTRASPPIGRAGS